MIKKISTESTSAVTPPKSGETGDSVQPKKTAPAKKVAVGKARSRPLRAGGWVIRNGRWVLDKGEDK